MNVIVLMKRTDAGTATRMMTHLVALIERETKTMIIDTGEKDDIIVTMTLMILLARIEERIGLVTVKPPRNERNASDERKIDTSMT